MKKSICLLMGAVACCIAMSASAQSVSTGKTRAQVRAELVQAQREGFVPAPKYDYPPGAEVVQRNAELYAIQHGGDNTRTVMQTPAHAGDDSVTQ
ncbi:DUF4148 domain-containing protein [Paraburkholderia azotifigens]|uniref:DUF4148 domain-containing protein n=2 Tax=Paraburkholderia azotifigens TaxID=2057004 RepID=A0ABU9QX48_9BURK